MAAVILAAIRVYEIAFLFMNIVWNFINISIAIWLSDHLQNRDALTFQWIFDYLIIVFGINLGLDMVYQIAGIYLLSRYTR